MGGAPCAYMQGAKPMQRVRGGHAMIFPSRQKVDRLLHCQLKPRHWRGPGGMTRALQGARPLQPVPGAHGISLPPRQKELQAGGRGMRGGHVSDAVAAMCR